MSRKKMKRKISNRDTTKSTYSSNARIMIIVSLFVTMLMIHSTGNREPMHDPFGMLACAKTAQQQDVVVVHSNSEGISVPVKSINQNGEKNLFLPSGSIDGAAGYDRIQFPESAEPSDYRIMTDENIGSLHFFSDDPAEKGMSYIHGSDDHSTKAPGRVVLLDKDLNVEYEGGVEAIKGRGNSTWKMAEKKPYQIKLEKKANLLDPGDDAQKAKKWILLADAFDTTLIRNEIAFSLAKEMGLKATPEGKQVELYYDGEYRGVYYLCEKVEIGKGRIEINDMEDHPEITTGGYLLEIDNMYFSKEPAFFIDKVAGAVVCKSPEEPADEQLDYIRGIVSEAMQCIKNGGKSADSGKTLFDYFDRDSLVRYFLVNEWIMNADAYLSSAYMYKPEDTDKLFMGPVWDCDYSMGKRITKTAYESWLLPQLARHLIRIPEFRQALQDEYISNMRPLIKDTLLGDNSRTYLKSYSEISGRMSTAALMNHNAWTLMEGGDGVKYWPVEIERLEYWLSVRAKWFDAQITDESFVKDSWEPSGKTDSDDKVTSNIPSTSKPVTNQLNKTSSVARPAKFKLKIKAKKRSLALSWAKVKKASGYQIRYYQKNNKSKSSRYMKTKQGKIKLKKLKRKTRYVVQVRAYRSVKGSVCYSPWITKNIKTR